MRFLVGQRFYSRNQPGRTADAVKVFDGGHEAWVQVRDESGQLLSEDRVNIAQMREYWTMCKPGFQTQVKTELSPF